MGNQQHGYALAWEVNQGQFLNYLVMDGSCLYALQTPGP